MKKIFFLLLITVLLNTAQAQVIITPNIVEVNITELNSFNEFHVDVVNQSSDGAEFFWMIVPGPNTPAEWSMYVCDNNLCYAPGVYKCPNSKPVIMTGNSQFPLKITVNPNGQSAMIDFHIVLFDDVDCQNQMFQTSLDGYINAAPVATNDVSTVRFDVFPNPVVDRFTVDCGVSYDKVELVDMSGRVVSEWQAVSNHTYYVDDVRDQMYKVLVTDETGIVGQKTLFKVSGN